MQYVYNKNARFILKNTQTIDAPRVAVVVEEPADDLTADELERGITLLRQLKRGEIEMVFAQKIRGGLYIKAAHRLL